MNNTVLKGRLTQTECRINNQSQKGLILITDDDSKKRLNFTTDNQRKFALRKQQIKGSVKLIVIDKGTYYQVEKICFE